MKDMTSEYKVLVGKPEGCYYLEDLKEYDLRVWTAFVWFFIGSSARLL
jgi:hypothetical protein